MPRELAGQLACPLEDALGDAAADHEQARGSGRDLDVGQFAKIGHRIDGDIGRLRLEALDLVLDQAKAGRAVGEGGAADRAAFPLVGLD